MTYDQEFIALFWSAVNKTDGCWCWIRKPGESGYGQIQCRRISQAPLLAHRVSWELSCGAIPEGLHVLHTCDNRICVRPDHLFLGTQDDNNDDRDRKGRVASGDRNGARTIRAANSFVRDGGSGLAGEDHPMVKLSDEQVAALLADYNESGRVRGVKARLAAKYGVSATHVGRLIKNRGR